MEEQPLQAGAPAPPALTGPRGRGLCSPGAPGERASRQSGQPRRRPSGQRDTRRGTMAADLRTLENHSAAPAAAAKDQGTGRPAAWAAGGSGAPSNLHGPFLRRRPTSCPGHPAFALSTVPQALPIKQTRDAAVLAPRIGRRGAWRFGRTLPVRAGPTTTTQHRGCGHDRTRTQVRVCLSEVHAAPQLVSKGRAQSPSQPRAAEQG